MGIVVRFRLRHARASSKGYKSGRSTCRETPVSRSIGNTNSAGTPFLDKVSQYQTCDCVVPMRFAKGVCPPASSQARLSASVDASVAVIGAQYPNLGKTQPKNLWKNTNLKFGSLQPMKVDAKAFGRRVRERRNELGWSQTRLEEESGIAQQTLVWIEKGGPKNPKRRAVELAEALRLHLNWLLYETGPREIGPTLLSKDELGAVYDDLSFEGKEAVMATAAKFTKKLKSA